MLLALGDWNAKLRKSKEKNVFGVSAWETEMKQENLPVSAKPIIYSLLIVFNQPKQHGEEN